MQRLQPGLRKTDTVMYQQVKLLTALIPSRSAATRGPTMCASQISTPVHLHRLRQARGADVRPDSNWNKKPRGSDELSVKAVATKL
jgi:hypothetical protein